MVTSLSITLIAQSYNFNRLTAIIINQTIWVPSTKPSSPTTEAPPCSLWTASRATPRSSTSSRRSHRLSKSHRESKIQLKLVPEGSQGRQPKRSPPSHACRSCHLSGREKYLRGSISQWRISIYWARIKIVQCRGVHLMYLKKWLSLTQKKIT